ncbi:MAG: hypothetical protein QGI83_19710 [Candidatus Latescibacteria bacterium]|nr:hypothetical protein [Candidatus Latescibacterota bacterium]
MIKILFFDYRQLESIKGFVRKLERPRKHSTEPIMDSVQTWGWDTMSLYGSVIRRPEDGLFQMWYTTRVPPTRLVLAYAESDDGIVWRRPELDIAPVEGRKTNIVFDQRPHGAAVHYDCAETNAAWRYKMMAGASPSGRIGAFHSADGIRWKPSAENPVIGTHPDCPIGLHRMSDGRFVAYHRPGFSDRRVARTESWNFRDFSEASVVMEPDQDDPPNTQFYGLGAVPYGAYLIGTLWLYYTDVEDMGFTKMSGYLEPEFVHARGSTCWHRTAQGSPWIPVAKDKKRFDSGQVLPASQPVFLEDEIRYYYAGTRPRHAETEWRRQAPRGGLGYASCKPDRFVGVTAKTNGKMLTRPFWTETARFCVNARIGKGGWLRAGILDTDGKPIRGLAVKNAVPISGNSTGHVLAWGGKPDLSALAHREIRVEIQCRNATIYSIYAGAEEEAKRYWEFRIPSWVNMEREKEMAWLRR